MDVTQAYAPSRVREAASYLLQSLASTEDGRRLATEAMEWLSNKGRTEAGGGEAEAEDATPHQ